MMNFTDWLGSRIQKKVYSGLPFAHMGLDVSIGTDKDDIVFDESYHLEMNKYSLSRTFCDLLCQSSTGEGNSVLDEVGAIANVDVTPLHQMNTYCADEELDFLLQGTDDEEKKKILEQVETTRNTLKNNIDEVLEVVDKLIQGLTGIDNLGLHSAEEFVDNNKSYFKSFKKDTGDGYMRNNLGQDLRNMKRFLEHARNRGVKSVFFVYG